MFSRDINHARPTPRSLQSSKFGPYARISIPQRRSKIVSVLWMLAYGVAAGAVWYVAVLVRVGS